MSKNVSVKEGDRARNFGPTAKIKTELQAGGSCYWVPEDERETGHIFASENREYTPDEINKYGIDSIDVNIIFTGTTNDGDPWSVTIDPDTGLPIIDIDDVEITIDDVTGDIDISTPDTDITIDDADLGDFGIDPDADIDISIDDLGNIEISDGDISIDFDPETGEWDTVDCPASISILSRPASLVYTDGDTLNFTGLAVEVLGADGMPWPDPEAGTWTEIPFDQLIISETKADKSNAEYENVLINGDTPAKGVGSGFSLGTIGPSPSTLDETWTVKVELDPNSSPLYLIETSDGWRSISLKGVNGQIVYRNRKGEWRGTDPLPRSLDININSVKNKGANVPVMVQWVTPCFETLETSFDITVYPRDGSHHSGKF